MSFVREKVVDALLRDLAEILPILAHYHGTTTSEWGQDDVDREVDRIAEEIGRKLRKLGYAVPGDRFEARSVIARSLL